MFQDLRRLSGLRQTGSESSPAQVVLSARQLGSAGARSEVAGAGIWPDRTSNRGCGGVGTDAGVARPAAVSARSCTGVCGPMSRAPVTAGHRRTAVTHPAARPPANSQARFSSTPLDRGGARLPTRWGRQLPVLGYHVESGVVDWAWQNATPDAQPMHVHCPGG